MLMFLNTSRYIRLEFSCGVLLDIQTKSTTFLSKKLISNVTYGSPVKEKVHNKCVPLHLAEKTPKNALSKDLIQKLRSNFFEDKKNVLAQNVCSRSDPFDVCLSRKQLEETQHVFNHKVFIINYHYL